MSVEEAVARFFPAGMSYDHNQATRLIRWLDTCGYVIAPKDATKGAQQESRIPPVKKAA
jgi:hypothetical protein